MISLSKLVLAGVHPKKRKRLAPDGGRSPGGARVILVRWTSAAGQLRITVAVVVPVPREGLEVRKALPGTRKTLSLSRSRVRARRKR